MFKQVLDKQFQPFNLALDFAFHLILSERSTNLTLRLSLKIKSFAKQNKFHIYSSQIFDIKFLKLDFDFNLGDFKVFRFVQAQVFSLQFECFLSK